jgi:hypothetical protein
MIPCSRAATAPTILRECISIAEIGNSKNVMNNIIDILFRFIYFNNL